jgi:hypothetical protein
LQITPYGSALLGKYASGGLGSDGRVVVYSGNISADKYGELKHTGLTFTDSNGNVTANYPATGLGMMKGYGDNSSQTGAVVAVPYATATDLGIGVNYTISDVCKAWAAYVASHLPNKIGCTFLGTALVGSYRMLRGMAYDTSDTDSNGVPNVMVVEHISYQGVMTHFTAINGTYTVKTVTQS